MKFLLASTVALFMMSAFAQDLSAMKKSANESLDKKMSNLQKSKNCVNSANTVDKFKACKVNTVDMDMQQKMEESKENLDDAL